MKALTQFMSIFGIPKVVQSEEGSNFSSKLFAEVLKPESSREVPSNLEELDRDWKEGLPWLMLAAREVSQESLGFSPNE